MIDDFIIRAIFAGVGSAVITGLLGCFVVWKRMAYFGDSLSHSAILGVAIGFILGISPNLGTVLICTFFAFLLLILQQKKGLATDTILGVLAHTSLSLGIIVISVMNQKIDLHSYFFGDLLTVTLDDIYWICFGSIVVLSIIGLNWSSLVLAAINEDLAKSENINVFLMRILLMVVIIIVIVVSIRAIGILLVTSLMIIPAAAARQIARSPEMMAVISVFIGVTSTLAGIYFSYIFDTLTVPFIVLVASVIFAIISLSTVLFARDNS